MVVLGGAYALIFSVLRRYLAYIGNDRVVANRERFQIAQESLGGIKDVKVLGLEEGYIRIFNKPAARFAKRKAANQVIGALPQYLLQGVAFGGILAILLVLLISRDGDLATVLPVMALYAFAGARLLPAMQVAYNALTKLQFGKPALDALHQELMEVTKNKTFLDDKHSISIPTPIKLKDRLEIKDVIYTYPKARHPALRNFSMSIPAKSTIALVGSTGAGKTTAVDLLLGLLVPQQGGLYIDGRRVDGQAIRAWQRNIGYVPQHIFLSDDTVEANIAFGQSEESIDLGAVINAARIADLHEFVLNELPDRKSVV